MIPIFCAIAVLAFALERVLPARPQPVLRRGIFTDGVYLVVNIALRFVFTNALGLTLSRTGARLLPDSAVAVLRDEPLWLQSLVVIAVLDFCFYWMHRAKHRWPWWWRLHETHHSSRDLDWFSSVRFHPLEKILDRTLYLLPLVFLGVTEEALLVLAAVDSGIASLAHANTKVRIGPLIYFFVGPEMHRWHHARDPAWQRCNFGNNLSVFDWIFGTARVPREAPREFGVDDEGYPEGSFLAQFSYAFRPREAGPPADYGASRAQSSARPPGERHTSS